MAWADEVEDGHVDDAERRAYIKAHMAAVREAIAGGANVEGFFYWSLLDNYEWTLGFQPRFGLIGVNYENYQRTIRPSAQLYAEIIKVHDRCLPVDSSKLSSINI